MCPDSIIPGLYSEGEFPVSEGQAILSALEDLEDGKLYLQLCYLMGTCSISCRDVSHFLFKLATNHRFSLQNVLIFLRLPRIYASFD